MRAHTLRRGRASWCAASPRAAPSIAIARRVRPVRPRRRRRRVAGPGASSRPASGTASPRLPDRHRFVLREWLAIGAAAVLARRRTAMRRIQGRPLAQRRTPFVRDFAQHGKARTRVFPAFVIVCRGGEHRMRKPPRAFLVSRMKLVDRQREFARVRTHFVARQQAAIAVTGGVLDSPSRRPVRSVAKTASAPCAGCEP